MGRVSNPASLLTFWGKFNTSTVEYGSKDTDGLSELRESGGSPDIPGSFTYVDEEPGVCTNPKST